MTLGEHKQQLGAAVAAIPAEVRAFALEVATRSRMPSAPGRDRRALRDDKLRSFAELMIDLEEEPARAVIVGELRRLTR